MPAKPRWLLALPDAIEQLEAFDRPVVTRRDVERLFGVSRAWAALLMRRFGADITGHVLTVPRADLLRRLRAQARGRAFRAEADRRARVVGELRQARISGVRVPVSPQVFETRLGGLPEGVVVEPGRLEVRFDGARDAVARLYAVAQALVNDYERFEGIVGSGSSPSPSA